MKYSFSRHNGKVYLIHSSCYYPYEVEKIFNKVCGNEACESVKDGVMEGFIQTFCLSEKVFDEYAQELGKYFTQVEPDVFTLKDLK